MTLKVPPDPAAPPRPPRPRRGRAGDQMAFPGIAPGAGLESGRNRKREDVIVYLLVTELRARGHRVTREGRHHMVDGRRLTTPELMRFAADLFPG
ncbi:MAG: hypothetical protein HY521_12140 [Proteobacteria bacterium]|nr:hypothetical protein [Pseudomonadota bacterium]